MAAAGGSKVLVLGAGPNGLTAAAYLAKAGCDVTVIEKNVETGGGLVTQELSGFKLNYHATYMMLGELMPPVADLDLRARGVEFVKPDAQVSFLFEDRSSFTLYSSLERSIESVKRIAAADAPRVGALLRDCAAMCEAFLVPATYHPPLEPIEQVEALNTAGDLGLKMGELGDLSCAELVASYGFEDPRVELGLLYLVAMFGLDPDEGGMGFLAPIYLHRLTQAALVKGGSHQLSSMLRRAVEDAGGTVVVNKAASRFLFEGSRVAGVRLSDGTELRADAVLSTLSPEQNFLELPGDHDLGEDLRDLARNWEWEKTSLYVLNAGIVGDAPRYEGYPDDVARSLNVVLGYETPGDLRAHLAEVAGGKIGRVAGHGTVGSLFDPLLVPSHVPLGRCHTLRWETIAPYDADWDSAGEDMARRSLDLWTRYAPNLRDANVRVSVGWTPRDIERHLPTMKRGSIKHGSYTTLQMGYNRPDPDCSSYRTPVEGLYLGGASAHPGGMVILGPGYNAARVVAGDLGAEIWWQEPEMVRRAREAGYLGEADAPDV